MSGSPGLIYSVLFAAALLALFGGGWLLWRLRQRIPENPEERRRQRVHRVGRIAEGRIIEYIDQPTDAESSGRLLVYRYEVRGVEYQAAQDISFYQQKIDLRRVAAGQTTSVKYDPRHPTNSIILCEDWSGV